MGKVLATLAAAAAALASLPAAGLGAEPPIPNILARYLANPAAVTYRLVSSDRERVQVPTDLDFDAQGGLWVLNRGTEASGSTTVRIANPGKPDQKTWYQKDGNAWHFMSLATGIAFGTNGNFATSTGVYDANHKATPGGTTLPFTGPTLWNSDTAIYAKPSGGNGSHIDMLHQSPYSMGIAHEKDNVYWVFDAHSGEVVRYDFAIPHKPGGSDHSDGIIRRYTEPAVKWISQAFPSHLILQKTTGWLYIVDGGNARVLRLKIGTGAPGGVLKFPKVENVKEYSPIAGATWEVVANKGLQQPVGIDVLDNHLLVSDAATGEIVFFDIAALPARELGRIKTGEKGVMGIVIGPDGRIWYVNGPGNKVMVAEPETATAILRGAGRAGSALRPPPSPRRMVDIRGKVRALGPGPGARGAAPAWPAPGKR